MNRTEYLLIKAAEGCGEVIQRLTKALRFGIQGVYQGETNEKLLADELNDLMAVLKTLEDENILDLAAVGFLDDETIESRQLRIEEYYNIAKELGIVVEADVATPEPINSQALALLRASQD